MYFDYLNLLVFASVGFAFVFVNVLISGLVRPKRKTDVGLEVYECGEPTIGDAWIQFDIRYYTVALIYVIFAVEITFLFPWAMVIRDAYAMEGIGFWALLKGFMFVTILFFGLIAVWVKGDLDWVLTYGGKAYVPTRVREAKPIPTVAELDPTDDGGDDGDGKDEEEAA
ncbi:MAG: NADH-quinone oxidoreductase subunit A [Planctomycetota bacterium]|nr:NADH-quinone oxidoreductase subunit A [Planctomycetota bacterium]